MILSVKTDMKCSAISTHFPIQINPRFTYTDVLLKPTKHTKKPPEHKTKHFPHSRLKEH